MIPRSAVMFYCHQDYGSYRSMIGSLQNGDAGLELHLFLIPYHDHCRVNIRSGTRQWQTLIPWNARHVNAKSVAEARLS